MLRAVRTICAFWTDVIFAPTLWACLGVGVHVFGTVVLRMRLHGWRGRPQSDRVPTSSDLDSADRQVHRLTRIASWIQGLPRRIVGILKTEFIPSAAARYEVRITEFVETKLFLFSAWALSMITLFHVIFGTVLFASTTFIGTRDALGVVGMYIMSATTCRVVLMYELAGLREANIQKENHRDCCRRCCRLPEPTAKHDDHDLSDTTETKRSGTVVVASLVKVQN
ncbi:hypothetical protein QBC34DRAFT_86043 [Podospora aff. communis PSN243]|uniref:Copper transporter n=1 Tax=Podospora aff. communis PSN243 TaxID=3040156 RepID=A0AAV9GND4_9PEZI|nr:hypothetical protein QBC34DRAFT_86043 [Podospora aff. communis PSN243]